MVMSVRPPSGTDMPQGALAEFLDRLRVPNVPPKPLDPANERPAVLQAYGIPLPPSRELQPLSHAFWRRLYAAPFTFLAKPIVGLSSTTQLSYLRSGPPTGRGEASSNWSGAYISPRDGEMFTEVHAIWRVPRPQARPDASPDERFESSTWIGLDGQRRYFNSSLPQIGTAQHVKLDNGVPTVTCSSWVQWWARDTEIAVLDADVDVAPDDEVACSIVADSPVSATFTMRNLTSGAPAILMQVQSPSAKPPGGTADVRIRISGATAQWVTERPINPDDHVAYRLPDYGSVLFADCHAVSASGPGQQGRDRDLSGARLITMYETRREPSRTAKISIPQWVDETYTATSYRHVP
jgi:hypothetical protein